MVRTAKRKERKERRKQKEGRIIKTEFLISDESGRFSPFFFKKGERKKKEETKTKKRGEGTRTKEKRKKRGR